MNNILQHIIAYKKLEVEARKKGISLDSLIAASPIKRPSLESSLRAAPGIIAEFKRRSPSRGVINDRSSIEEVTKGYYEKGAAALSILTDLQSFGGSLKDLDAAKNLPLPLLRKDFIVDPFQIAEARAHGASVILLIASCLSKEEISAMANFARELGMETLLEIHEEKELHFITEDIKLVGINNRNLKDFSVDIDRSLRMAEKLPAHTLAIAESGINSAAEIRNFISAGFRGFLIGDLFMRQPNPSETLRKLREDLQ